MPPPPPLAPMVASRNGLAGAMVLGTEVLLGALPMEDLDLVVVPGGRQVVPNPNNPNVAASIAKGVRWRPAACLTPGARPRRAVNRRSGTTPSGS